MSFPVVAVVRGGPGVGYDASIASGGAVLATLSRERFDLRDLLIGKDGTWQMDGVVARPDRVLRTVDVAINALHGEYADTGEVHRILNAFGVPYTGSGSYPCSMFRSIPFTRNIAARVGLSSLRMVAIRVAGNIHEQANRLIAEVPFPHRLYPAVGSLPHAPFRARHFEDLLAGVHAAADFADTVLVESARSGRRFAVCVIENFRNESLYTLPPVEVSTDVPIGVKYEHILAVPAVVDIETKQALAQAARAVYREIGARHYARCDFLVTDDGGILFSTATALPVLSREGVLPQALASVGANLEHFLEHTLDRTRDAV